MRRIASRDDPKHKGWVARNVVERDTCAADGWEVVRPLYTHPAPASADTERLDWLERTVREHEEVSLVWSDAGTEHIDGYKVNDWPASFEVFGHGAGHDRPTLRESLDAARAGGGA
jgi:hypothetical protein